MKHKNKTLQRRKVKWRPLHFFRARNGGVYASSECIAVPVSIGWKSSSHAFQWKAAHHLCAAWSAMPNLLHPHTPSQCTNDCFSQMCPWPRNHEESRDMIRHVGDMSQELGKWPRPTPFPHRPHTVPTAHRTSIRSPPPPFLQGSKYATMCLWVNWRSTPTSLWDSSKAPGLRTLKSICLITSPQSAH